MRVSRLLLGFVLLMLSAHALAAERISAQTKLAQQQLDARIEALYRDIEPKVADAPTTLAAAALAALNSNAPPIFVDVRAANERQISMIAGAVDVEALPALHLEYPERPVVVYCTIGYRSGITTRALQALQIPARNLRGGILAWIAAGGGLVDAQLKPSHQVHVYAKAWAAVPDEFEAIY